MYFRISAGDNFFRRAMPRYCTCQSFATSRICRAPFVSAHPLRAPASTLPGQPFHQKILVRAKVFPPRGHVDLFRLRVNDRESVVGDAEAEFLHHAQVLPDGEIDGHSIEQRAAALVSHVHRQLGVADNPDAIVGDDVGDVAVGRIADVPVFVAGQGHEAAGVERRDGDVPRGGKNLLAGLGIGLHVPFRLGLLRSAVTHAHAALHAHEPGMLRNARLAFQRLGDVRHGADANQRHGLRRVHYRVNDGLHAVGADFARIGFEIVVLDPRGLAAVAVRCDVEANAHGHVGSPGAFEQFREQPRAVLRLAVIAHHQFQVQLRRFEQQGQRPGVVDVIADVRVEDDGDGCGFGGLRFGGAGGQGGEREAEPEQAKAGADPAKRAKWSRGDHGREDGRSGGELKAKGGTKAGNEG